MNFVMCAVQWSVKLTVSKYHQKVVHGKKIGKCRVGRLTRLEINLGCGIRIFYGKEYIVSRVRKLIHHLFHSE